MNKCLFSKSTDNVNTSVIVKCSLGYVTVHISDEFLNKTLVEVKTEVSSLVVQAENLATMFGFNLIESISKGGMMSISDTLPSSVQPPAQIQSSIQSPVQVQPLAQPQLRPVNIIQQPLEQRPHVDRVAQINENVEPNKHVVKQIVQSPHGRTFELDNQINDEHGSTVIVIDTESETAFNEKLRRDIAAAKNGQDGSSFKDGYGVDFQQCKLCYDRKTGQSTGKTNGNICPKCKGSGEIVITR